MKILVHFAFSRDQIKIMQKLASSMGDHQLFHVESDEAAITKAPGTDALLGHFSPEVLTAAPSLRWIQSFSAGMNNFLFPEIVESDVVVTNMAGIYASQGAEHAWALLLALSRGLHSALHRQSEHRWGADGPQTELTGSVLGIIGLGGFGIEIAQRAAGYNMEIIALDPIRSNKPEYVNELFPSTRNNLTELLQRSDAVVLACPRTSETYHLIGHEQLCAMKKSAYLINVTRGGIIDERALIAALKSGDIAGAGLDVCEEEPLPPGNPLWDAPNLIITPHNAGSSQHRPQKTFEFFCKNLKRFLQNRELLNVVDKAQGF